VSVSAGRGGEPLRVLQLEDSASDAELVQHELAAAGYAPQATVVHDRAGFLAALDCPLDLVIADYQLPAFTGLEALRLARERRSDLPFIVVTGAVGEEKAAECMREGADDLLMKDRLARLGPAVRRALEARRLRGEHRATVERLRESEERFRRLIAACPLPIAAIDTAGIVRLWNPASERVFGWTAAEAVGGLLPYLGDENRGEHEAIERRVLAGGMISGMEITRRRRDGSAIDLTLYVAPLHDAAGRVIGNVALLEDITERRRREKQWRELSAAMEHAPDTIVVTDADRRITWVNPTFESVTLWSRTDAVGKTPRILRSGLQDDAFYASMWKTVFSGAVWHGRMVNRRRDGTLYHEDETIAPIKGGDGATIGYVGIGRDVTAEVKLEASLRQAQKMEAIGQLAGGVAHDINNMLQVIGGYLEVIGLQGGGRPLPHLEEIRRATDRAARLTQQLLAFSRRQDLQLRPLDLNDLVSNAMEMIRRLVGEHVRLVFRPGSGLSAVNADAGQLEQVLMNLCLNARDAMPSGGDLLIVTEEVRLDDAFASLHPGSFRGQAALLSVSDTGVGVDEETRGRLFDPFFTTKEEGRGTGLGLSVVYGIVKQHGGYIDVESAQGRGTTFRVYLPTLSAAPVPVAADVESAAAPGGTETVLLAEDEASIRDLAVMVLVDAGYRVLAAADGMEALERFRQCPRDIDAFRRMREEGASFPVLFATGYAAGTVQEQIARESDADLLHKPFAMHELLVRVRRLLDRARGEPGGRPTSGGAGARTEGEGGLS
jgi:PAS domain S-box-containing protein